MESGVHRVFRRRNAAWLTLFGGLILTSALGWELNREAVELDRQRLAMRVAEIQSQLDSRLERSEMMLHNLRDYLIWSGQSREDVFQRWCYENGLSINCPWVHGIIVATNRTLPTWPTEVPASPKVWMTNDWDWFSAYARSHRIECDIAMQSSLTNTKRFLTDYDLRGSMQERTWFSRTVGNSRLAMTQHGPVMLDAKSNIIVGTSFLVPVYKPEMSGRVADLGAAGWKNPSHRSYVRWLHLTSIILAPVDFSALVQSLWEDSPSDLGLELFSSTNQTTATWLNLTEGIPRAVDPSFKPYLTQRLTWPMYGQRFSIFFYTTPLFESQSPRRLAKAAMAAGIAVTLLATALVGVELRSRNRLEAMTEQIRAARDALAAAQQEREKLNHDLHDGTIQSLYAIQLGLGHTVENLKATPGRAGLELSAVRRDLDAVIAEIRQFITSEAGDEQPVDLSAVLKTLVQRAQGGATAKIVMQCDPDASLRLTGKQAVQLANIAREALSNGLRHAKPQQVCLTLRSDAECLVLEVSDDGMGFDPKAKAGRPGVGLASMSCRAQDLGGTLEVHSSPGNGTRVVLRIPARQAVSRGGARTFASTDES